jgi:hypothetical protein
MLSIAEASAAVSTAVAVGAASVAAVSAGFAWLHAAINSEAATTTAAALNV